MRANHAKPAPRRRTPRQRRAQATVDAILEATAQILGSDGAPGLSTNRIAQRAGVSVGTLYQYFEDKEAILRLMCERHVATMRDAVTTQLARAEGTTLETGTRAILEALLHAQTEHRTVNRLLQERVPHLIGVAHLDQIHAMLGTLVREGLAQRVDALRRVDLDLATFLIVNAVFGVSTAALRQEPRVFDNDAVAGALTEMIVRYLQDVTPPLRSLDARPLLAGEDYARRPRTDPK